MGDRLMRIVLLFLMGLALSACAGGDRLATVSGPCWPLNAGQWSPAPGLSCPPAVAHR
jgi:hypothetical protein